MTSKKVIHCSSLKQKQNTPLVYIWVASYGSVENAKTFPTHSPIGCNLFWLWWENIFHLKWSMKGRNVSFGFFYISCIPILEEMSAKLFFPVCINSAYFSSFFLYLSLFLMLFAPLWFDGIYFNLGDDVYWECKGKIVFTWTTYFSLHLTWMFCSGWCFLCLHCWLYASPLEWSDGIMKVLFCYMVSFWMAG